MKRLNIPFLFVLIIPTALLVLTTPPVREDFYYYVVGLDSDDTVGDYKSASTDKRVHWELNACNSGACLLYVDWKCGFSNGDFSDWDACTRKEILHADIGTKLDTIRKRCGRRHMEFVGELHANREECEPYGTWGKIN